MNAQYWIDLQHTALWAAVDSAGLALWAGFMLSIGGFNRSVRGTRQRYMAATLVRGLGVPAAACEVLDAVVDAAAGDGFGAGVCAVSAVGTAWLVQAYRDDDFWSDTSKKIKRALKSLRLGGRPAFAGSGA